MKQILLLFVFALFTISCRHQSECPPATEGSKFIGKFAKVAKDEYDLFLFGQGGAFRDGVSLFHFHFISKEMLDVNQARRFYLKVMDRILEMINADESLRPYLTHYPFTHRGLDLGIAFSEDYNLDRNPPAPYLAYVSGGNDKIGFSAYCNKPDKLETVHIESFERARKIVEYQNTMMLIPEGSKW